MDISPKANMTPKPRTVSPSSRTTDNCVLTDDTHDDITDEEGRWSGSVQRVTRANDQTGSYTARSAHTTSIV